MSRETRRLLATVLLSLAALWILARIRFPERPPAPNPVAPVLSQIAPRIAFEDLERAVFDVQPALLAGLSVLAAEQRPAGSDAVRRESFVSVRFRADAALAAPGSAWWPAASSASLARDRATGLAVIATAASDAAIPQPWQPVRNADYPRYLIAAEAWRGQVVLRPLFFGPLDTTYSAAWRAEVWSVPPYVELRPGSLLFTTTGALVGLVAAAPDNPVLVPASVAISAAERLLEQEPSRPGWLGIEVRPLTSRLYAAAGVGAGVVVAFVSPQGPAAGNVVPTDVVESVGADAIGSAADWDASVARLTEGQTVTLRIRRAGQKMDVPLTAGAAPAAAPASTELGLTMRYRRAVGVEVLAVRGGSVAMRAGLRPGDVLTRVGAVDAPTPAQVSRAFAASQDGGVLVALTRGPEHLVAAVGR